MRPLGLAPGPWKAESFFFLAFLFPAISLGAGEGLDVVALVSGEPITLEEFDEYFNRPSLEYNNTTAWQARSLRRKALQELIDRKLLLQEARRRGVKPTPAAVERVLAENERAAALEGRRLDPHKARQTARENATLGELLKAITWVKEPRDQDIEELYWDDLSAQSRPAQKRASQILVSSRKEAQRILTALGRGGEFSLLAQRHSTSPEGKRGGDLGWIGKGDVPRFLWKALDSMSPGQTQGPLKSPWGYHVLWLREARPARMLDWEEARQALRKAWQRDQEKEFVEGLTLHLRSRAEIKVDLELMSAAVDRPKKR